MDYTTGRHPKEINLMKFSLIKCSLLLATMIYCVSSNVPVFAKEHSVRADSLAMLRNSFDGSIGIYAVNTANHSTIQYHADKRFPIQSTFKVMAVSAILKQSMTDNHLLTQIITYKKEDLVFWSPITEKHVADGMTISDLCSAAMMYSDNTATNLLVKKLGGPEAVTAFARSIGDSTFRVDGWEPELNSNPNNLQDTSTPAAMEKSLKKLTLGNVLGSAQREQLVTWMKGNTTGDTRIRAGVPKGWTVADKTGAGSYGTSNDIGIIWSPKCAPIFVSLYSIQNKKDATRRDDVIAKATTIVINSFAEKDTCLKQDLALN